MFDPDVSNVCSFLKSKNILINPSNKWMQDCVSCFKKNTPSFSLELLKNFVFEQWLLADLRDISAPTLPQECKNAPKFLLPDKYAVQINYSINVAEAFHKQLQKIRRPEAEANLSVDVEKEKNQIISSNRMYKFEITDGVIVLKGFEDIIIPNLPATIVPGEKAILNGPIECRQGILFLKKANIQLLGGEVDTLLIPNCTENILARTLGLPENPNPYRLPLDTPENDYTELMDEDKDLLLQVAEEMDDPMHCKSSIVQNPNFSDTSLHVSNKSDSCVLINMSNESSVVCLDDSDDDNFAVLAAETAAAAEEKNSNKSNSSKELNSNKSSNPGIQKKMKKNLSYKEEKSTKLETQSNIDNFVTRKVPPNEKNSMKSYSSSSKTSSFKDLRSALQESYSHFSSDGNSTEGTVNNEKDWFPPPHKFNLEIPRSHSDEGKIIVDITEEFPLDSVPTSKSEEPKETLSKSNSNIIKDDFPPKNVPCTKIVLGKVVKVSQKLGLSNDKWSLSVILSVRGVELEVDFSSETLDKLFGLTASQLQAQRNEVKKNPAMKDKINGLLKTSQQRIRQLHSKMKIHFSNFVSKPVIIEIIDDVL